MMHSFSNGMYGFWLFGLIILIFIAALVANDANKAGGNGLLWALLVIVMPMVGLLIYLAVKWNGPFANSGQTQYNAQPIAAARSTRPPRREIVNYRTTDNELLKKPSVDSKDIQYCTSCGHENNSNASFCNVCGVKILSLGV